MGLLPAGFRFSQASLATAHTCQRRFYLRYLRRLAWPAAADPAGLAKEAGAARGRLFHHLVHQHTLGLPVEAEVQAHGDPTLSRWWEHFLRHPPRGVPTGQVYTEWELWVPLGVWWLQARFDRVVVEEQGGLCIVDWKTGRAPGWRYLESWQTLVYCFVACEGAPLLTGGRPVLPEQISLCYWQAERPGEEQWYRYGLEAHRQARFQLEDLVQQLAGLSDRAGYAMTADHQACADCEFRAYCGRGTGVGLGWEEEAEEGEEDNRLGPTLDPGF